MMLPSSARACREWPPRCCRPNAEPSFFSSMNTAISAATVLDINLTMICPPRATISQNVSHLTRQSTIDRLQPRWVSTRPTHCCWALADQRDSNRTEANEVTRRILHHHRGCTGSRRRHSFSPPGQTIRYRFLKTMTRPGSLGAALYGFSLNGTIFGPGGAPLSLDRGRNCVPTPNYFSITI